MAQIRNPLPKPHTAPSIPNKTGGPERTCIRGRLLRLFRDYEAIFAIWNMDAGIGRSNDQRICIGLEPS